jgi:hypothetical protein
MNSEASADVRSGADCGLKPDVTRSPESANKRHRGPAEEAADRDVECARLHHQR